jgi:septal ring factor EnvC (AmiA/AmiB activator)
MTELVTLEQLEQLDAAIAETSDRVVYLAAELARARQRIDALRAEQARAVAEYNRQAARPLTP